MALPERVLRHLGEVIHCLALPTEARSVLALLAQVDVDRGMAESARKEDEQGRLGVMSWQRLISLLPPSEEYIDRLETAVVALADWGLIQIVGERPNDPILPGSAPMRLTFAGRVAIGLAPSHRASAEDRQRLLAEEPSTWQVWHSASREGLLMELARKLGSGALQPLSLSREAQDPHSLISQITMTLCTRSMLVIDGFALQAQRGGAALLEKLLWRTRLARAPRFLVLPSPELSRVAVLISGGHMRWVESELHGRREVGRFDRSVTDHLRSSAGDENRVLGLADVCGVPDNELASPRRVHTPWEALMLPSHVRHQFDQVLLHARFRLSKATTRAGSGMIAKGYRLMLSGLPGTGKSMAAEALANTLDRMIVKLDLSSVLSKWLGETEKLLAQIFEVAEVTGSVLVLDEAESLFRQRDSGPGGRDGMGTVVAYLLARLDRFEGVLVATTNRTQDLDEAFFRRFDDYVVLPVPNEETRKRLWTEMLKGGIGADSRVLTGDDPLSGIDLHLVSRRFAIAGGLIRKAAIRAVAWSEGLEQPLSTSIVLASLARELEKNDRSTNLVFVEPFREEVERLLSGSTKD